MFNNVNKTKFAFVKFSVNFNSKSNYFNFARKRVIPGINISQKANLKMALQLNNRLQKHNFDNFSNPIHGMNLVLERMGKKEIIDKKFEEIRKKYPTPDDFFQSLLEEKRKINPNFTLDDMTDEEVLMHLDPEIFSISKEIELELNSSQNKQSSVSTENIPKFNEKEDKKIENLTNISNKSNSLEPKNKNDHFESTMKQMKFDEKETDINKIRNKIFKEDEEIVSKEIKNKTKKDTSNNPKHSKRKNKRK